ncbi:MAG: heparinase II/III family protein, partial [Bacteroides sp.]
MKNYLLFLLLILSPQFSFGQEVAAHVFELIDLDYPGLEKVKKNYNEGNLDFALDELLSYYRGRQGINHPDIDLNQLSLSPRELKIADEGLKHQFFVHKGYQPSFFYGEDIDWTYWPVKDNELRWQLHRTKWWQPMGKAYQVSKDEKYAKEWTLQYLDWIYKNPLL